jgi:hypothetical protein
MKELQRFSYVAELQAQVKELPDAKLLIAETTRTGEGTPTGFARPFSLGRF